MRVQSFLVKTLQECHSTTGLGWTRGGAGLLWDLLPSPFVCVGHLLPTLHYDCITCGHTNKISFLAAIDTSQYFVWWTWAWIWPLIVWLLLFVPPQVSSNQSFMCVPPQVSNSCCKNWADHLMNIKIRFRPKQLLWRFKMQRRSVWKT